MSISCIYSSLSSAQEYVNKIKSISYIEVEEYWETMHYIDQSKRGTETDVQADNDNFKKVILMIRYHGYPTGSLIPNLIFTHQRSTYVREHYFPVFYEAYKNGKADTSWFLHNLRGMFRDRFGCDLIKDRKLNAGDVDTLLSHLKPFISGEIDLTITKFDSLYTSYIHDINKIKQGNRLYKWSSSDGTTHSFYRLGDKLYYLKEHADKSGPFPQLIIADADVKTYRYVERVNEDYFVLDNELNLNIFRNGKLFEINALYGP